MDEHENDMFARSMFEKFNFLRDFLCAEIEISLIIQKLTH